MAFLKNLGGKLIFHVCYKPWIKMARIKACSSTRRDKTWTLRCEKLPRWKFPRWWIGRRRIAEYALRANFACLSRVRKYARCSLWCKGCNIGRFTGRNWRIMGSHSIIQLGGCLPIPRPSKSVCLSVRISNIFPNSTYVTKHSIYISKYWPLYIR